MFDSGIGGLTVLRALWADAPHLDVCYFGDIANIPYGTRETEDLERLTLRAMRLLRHEGATTLVSACHSVSASVIRPIISLFGMSGFGIVEMVGPVTAALAREHAGRIVIAMTEATARSHAYEEGFGRYGITSYVVTCNDLAPAVERGAPTQEIAAIVDRVVAQAIAIGCETFILGCTHFPFVQDAFASAFAARGASVRIVDPAACVADAVVRAAAPSGSGRGRFLLSCDSDVFRATVAREFPQHALTIDIIPTLVAPSAEIA